MLYKNKRGHENGAPMSDMTVEEFATKAIEDRDFMKQVAQKAKDVDLQADNGLVTAFHTAAQRMGHEYDFNELGMAVTAKIKSLGVFGVIKFVRAFNKAHMQAIKEGA